MNDFDKLFGWIEETSRAFDMAMCDTRSAYAQNFPPMNSSLDEETGELTLEFALAGYAPEEISATFTGDRLKLAAMKEEINQKGKKMLKHGIRARNFEVSYVLPTGKFNTADATATYKNGLLKLVLMPAKDMTPKKLPILLA
jgi:HSP20 family molecular chaperone IbpA